MCDPGPNSGLYWIGDPPGAPLPPVVCPGRVCTERGAQPTEQEFTEVSACNLLFGGIKTRLFIYLAISLPVASDIIPTLILSWIFVGLAIILTAEEICDLDKPSPTPKSTPGVHNRHNTEATRRIPDRRLVDSQNRIRPPSFVSQILECIEYAQASSICSGTIFADSMPISSLAVAALANTARMVWFRLVLAPGEFGTSSFVVSRTYEGNIAGEQRNDQP
ncbi:hypothetical protein HOY80DRAFT_1033718 [Tuber brumale]|nr:hypothetical protein HOY80DRAFT_1033718 [Tuber brumale]